MGAISITGAFIFLSCLTAIVFIIVKHNMLFQKTMDNISGENRQIPGKYIWLNLIPIFNIFWILIFNCALNKSIDAEIRQKGMNYRFFGIGGVLYPLMFYIVFSFYLIVDFIGTINYNELNSEITLITLIFSVMTIIWGWLYYIAEITSFNKMNTESEDSNYKKIAINIIVIVSVLLTLVLSYNYWRNYTAQQEYERSLN